MSTNEQLADRHWRSRNALQAPNHHLWNNHGTWWIHYTVHHGPTKERVRQSLATRCLNEARRKRDALFEAFFLAGRCAT